MLRKALDFLSEYLRINAIRRMLSIVDVRRSELAGLVGFAVIFALFEGVGLSLLLPVLQYAESGRTAIQDDSGFLWRSIAWFMEQLHLPSTLPVLLTLAFVPILLRQGVFYLNTWYSAVVSGRIGIRMRMKTLRTVMDADPEFFSRHPVGQLVGVVIGQTAVAGGAVLAVIRQLSIALLMALYAAILLAISVPLTATALFFALLVSVVVKRNIARIRDYGLESARVSQQMMGKIVERLGLMRLIKLRDQKAAEARRIEDFSTSMFAIAVKQARLGATIEVTADPLLMLSVFVTLFIGISVLGMTLAQLGMVLFLLNRLNAKVKEFNAGRQAISSSMSGLILVREMTDAAQDANTIRRGRREFTGLRDALEFDDVFFEYPDVRSAEGVLVSEKKRVLEGVSARIPSGSFTALVGRSGAGKSTLVELIPRLRDVSSGSIRFDGVDVREFDVGTLRTGIGYLTQNPLLFNDTVRENLIYGLDRVPGDEELASALERAYATFVYELPKGLETRLGDQGVRFSGGERQRIALARVLLEDTSVLVLDEPTSALDSESESYIQQALAQLHGEKTVIVIAHRLATVVAADQILVMDGGMVVDRGTHEELLKRGGAYRTLFESQLIR